MRSLLLLLLLVIPMTSWAECSACRYRVTADELGKRWSVRSLTDSSVYYHGARCLNYYRGVLRFCHNNTEVVLAGPAEAKEIK